MVRCPACSAEVVEGGRYCSGCGAVLLGLALYGFKVSLAGQPLFRDDLLDLGAAPRR